MSEVVSSYVEPEAEAAEVVTDQNTTESATVEAVKDETVPDQKAADEPADPEKVKADEVKKSQSRFDRKIDKLHRERAEAVARSDNYQRQFEDLQASLRPPEPYGKPKLEDFNDIDSYADAVAEFKHGEYQKTSEQNQRQASEQSQITQLQQGWENQLDAAETKYEDYHATVGSYNPDPSVPWSRAIMSAENGADIAYHLQGNIKEAQRIAQLDPFNQVFEIGKLSTKLANQAPVARQASRAPTPIKPLSGGSTNSDKPMSEMNYDEQKASRLQYIANKRK